PIAVASASEDHNQLATCQFASGCEHVAQRIVGVSVVDHDQERLTSIDALKPSRYRRQALDACLDFIGGDFHTQGGRRRRKDVVKVHAAHKWRLNLQFAVRDPQDSLKPSLALGKMPDLD